MDSAESLQQMAPNTTWIAQKGKKKKKKIEIRKVGEQKVPSVWAELSRGRSNLWVRSSFELLFPPDSCVTKSDIIPFLAMLSQGLQSTLLQNCLGKASAPRGCGEGLGEPGCAGSLGGEGWGPTLLTVSCGTEQGHSTKPDVCTDIKTNSPPTSSS